MLWTELSTYCESQSVKLFRLKIFLFARLSTCFLPTNFYEIGKQLGVAHNNDFGTLGSQRHQLSLFLASIVFFPIQFETV